MPLCLTPSYSKVKMLVLFIAIFLLKLDIIHSLDIVEASIDKSCPLDKQCATRVSCPFWIEKNKELKLLQKGSRARSRLIQEFKSAICNKEKKALCCPKISSSIPNRSEKSINVRPQKSNRNINDSPTYLPVAGECGLNPQKPPSSVSIIDLTKI